MGYDLVLRSGQGSLGWEIIILRKLPTKTEAHGFIKKKPKQPPQASVLAGQSAQFLDLSLTRNLET